MMPLVSVILPVYNAALYLAQAVQSIFGQQGAPPYEIIAVDDGSTDSSADCIASLGGGIRLVAQPNRGPAAARNAGLRLAQGEIIAFLDADDLWPENKLALQTARLQQEPDLDVVMGRVEYFGPLAPGSANAPESSINVNLGCGLFRRRAFDQVGLFDERLRNMEDHDWFLRARERGLRMVILKEVTLLYRMHALGTSRQPLPGQTWSEGLPSLLKRSLDRRRQDGPAQGLAQLSDYDDRAKGDA